MRAREYLLVLTAILVCGVGAIALSAEGSRFSFAILGDRTGEAEPGVYQQVWKEISAERPAFAVSIGDTIQGLDDAKAAAEWVEAQRIWKPYREIPLYLTPGNHDIWSVESEQLFRKFSGHPLHYSFDYGQGHFIVLDNSRSDELSAQELDFLEADLKAHPGAVVKMIFSHRPSWLLNVGFQNPDFRLHRLAKQYGVRYIIAGHVHQMLRFELEGVTYISMASSGGHLRLSKAYKDGWFFGHARVDVDGPDVQFRIEELKPPFGEGRVTKPADWGMNGLVAQRAAGGSWLAGIPAR